MLKEHKHKMLIASIVTLLPAVFGLFFWKELPEQITTHWGPDGTPDGWSGRAVAVFAPPVIMLLLQWLCIFITTKDPKNQGQNRKVFNLMIWIIPILSLFTSGMTYAIALGKEFSPVSIVSLLMGIVFLVIGNYLPKCKQNYTLGIKVKWTLENEENWNATHRFSGKVWVIGGLLLAASVLLPGAVTTWAMMVAPLPLALLPVLYSYRYHRKQVQAGTAMITPLPESSKTATRIVLIFTAALLLFLGIIMFTGDIDVFCEKDAFTIRASFWNDRTVEYDAITAIEYRDTDNCGSRTNGFANVRLLAGIFHNEEFEYYTRYSYAGCDACVVMTVGGKTLVLNGPDAESTKTIYNEIRSHLQ